MKNRGSIDRNGRTMISQMYGVLVFAPSGAFSASVV
jgi:hypothetical protein